MHCVLKGCPDCGQSTEMRCRNKIKYINFAALGGKQKIILVSFIENTDGGHAVAQLVEALRYNP